MTAGSGGREVPGGSPVALSHSIRRPDSKPSEKMSSNPNLYSTFLGGGAISQADVLVATPGTAWPLPRRATVMTAINLGFIRVSMNQL